MPKYVEVFGTVRAELTLLGRVRAITGLERHDVRPGGHDLAVRIRVATLGNHRGATKRVRLR